MSFEEARILFESSKYSEAATILSYLESKSDESHYLHGLCLLKTHSHSEALKKFLEISTGFHDQSELSFNKAVC